MSIVQTTDFRTGEFTLATNTYTTDHLTAMITSLEREWLIKLLGAELYALFYADLDGADPDAPQTAIYTTIYNQGAWDDYTSEVLISKGIPYMLRGIIYYHFVKDSQVNATSTGLVSASLENGLLENKEKGGQVMLAKLGEAMKTFNAIQTYIKNNSGDYPDFNGMTINQPLYFW